MQQKGFAVVGHSSKVTGQPQGIRYDPPVIRGQGRFIASDPVEIRALDVLGAACLLLFFLPLMILIALAVFVSNPGPVFFSQTRIGRNGKPFKCHKFRTMATDAEARLANLLSESADARAEWERDYKLRVDPRIVGIGRFLRKSSLDELPQLWNVMMGEMSLVGPRPIVEGEVSRYGKYVSHYYSVRPGLTGLWQISGRNDVSYRRRVAYDVLYARKSRIGDNMRILALTVPCVLARRGSY